ncbi:uncharacterized protein LOC131232639 isoform X2 [Magnolia sinica]|uniref:uncharacterized protein LOC131232639 isoform X2 n=1 Tax=Magnolia sinica TaxID=86752 RepID=UPI002658E7FF|nr:uncharacterized protein LOC131232639 isoform X2 [Magnolia sinica]
MPRRKERTLKELYDLTDKLSEPEAFLKGCCRIQGPGDELDQDLRPNTEVSAEKKFGKVSLFENVCMRAESGTCNVCAAPCSSCMHFNRTVSVMESKIEDDFSHEICKGKEPLFKSRACDDRQHATSEASNLFSASSSHDSLSENAESKATMRTCDTSDAFEDVDMLPKFSSGSNLGEGKLHTTQCNTVAQSAVTSHVSIPSALGQRTLRQGEEHQGPECHGDNISCVTGVKDGNLPVSSPNVDSNRKKVSYSAASTSSFVVGGSEEAEKAVQVQNAPGCLTDSHHEIEESKHNSLRPSISTKDTSQKKRSGFSSATDGVSECPSSKDVCEGGGMQKSQLPHSHSESKSFSRGDPRDVEENSSSQLQAGPSECSTEHLESSLAGQVTISSGDGQKKSAAVNSSNIIHSSIEDGKENLGRANSSPGALMKIHPCSETEIDTDGRDPRAESMKHSDVNQQFEKSKAVFEASDKQGTTLQSPISNSEHSGSDIVEDDVKVCDICGDAGREEMLAICSRCSDGAEHIYCMRIMLDKVPDGDWLCEECQLKDAEKQNLDKIETEPAAPKAPSLSEKSQSSNPKLLLKLDAKAQEEEADQATKVITSPRLSTKRHAESLEVTSLSKKVAIETSTGLPGMAILSKKSELSRESSFKHLDAGKVKAAHSVPSSGSHAANGSQETSHSLSTAGPNASKSQGQLQSPRGPLSRSSTFNSLPSKPKVKQLSEDFSLKQKLARESSISGTRKDGLTRTIGKSMSFKSTSLSHLNSESKAKILSPNLSRDVDLRGLKQGKEQTVIERKNSFRSDRPVVSSSSAAVISTSLPKFDLKNSIRGETIPSHSLVNNSHDPKATQRDANRHNSSKPAVLIANKGSENVIAHDGCEAKKQSSLAHGLGTPSSNGICSSEDQKSCQVGPKEDATANSSSAADKFCGGPDVHMTDVPPQSRESTNRDGKPKDASALSWLRQTVSSGSKNIRCHRCNEMGHDAQLCKAGSIQVSALKPSAVKNLREVTNKSSKWKGAVAAVSRTKMHKNDRLPDQSDELPMSSTNMSCEVAFKDQLSSSSGCVANLPSPGGTVLRKEALRRSVADSSKATTIVNVKQQGAHATEAVCAPREADLNVVPTISDETKLKPSMINLPIQAPAVANPSRISAIPEHDHIWHGSFEVQRSGRLPDFYDGIQAHMSTCASPKVLEVVKNFPSRVRLEEAPRLTSWPMQFQGNCTTEDNIALYFFARDLESYERNYKKLLQNMSENDLALKGNVDGIELLIFPSNQLPEKSQRWNRLFFLWAVFRERKWNCSESLADSHKKLCGATLDAEPTEQDLPTPVTDKELSRYDRSPEARVVKSSIGDLPSLSSSGRVEGNCYTKESSLDQRSLSYHEFNQSSVVEKHTPDRHTSCSFPEIRPSVSASQQASLPATSPLLRITTNDAQLCSEVKGNSASLKEVYRDSKSGNSTELRPCVQAASVQIDLNKGKAVPMYLDTSNCGQASFTSSSPDRRSASSDCLKIFSSSSLVQEAGAEGSGGQENLKDLDREKSMNNSTCLESDKHGDLIMKEQSSWELRSSRKRLHPNSSEMVSEASGILLNRESRTMPWGGKAERIQIDGENECKKMKAYNDSCVGSSTREQILGEGFSSKMLGMDPGFLKEQKGDCVYDYNMPESSKAAEMFFFPVDTSPISNCKSGNSAQWKILQSDRDPPELDIPNLELALGAKKKPSKPGFFPLFPGSIDEKSSQNKLPDPPVDDGDDELSSSLSLSLAFPFPVKEQSAKSAPKTEQLLPETHHVNTSLLLFGGFPDT